MNTFTFQDEKVLSYHVRNCELKRKKEYYWFNCDEVLTFSNMFQHAQIKRLLTSQIRWVNDILIEIIFSRPSYFLFRSLREKTDVL